MRHTFRRTFAAALLLVALPVVSAHSADDLEACNARNPGQITVRGDGWARILPPKHDADEGPATIKSFATSPGLTNQMFSTNGDVVKITADAGCSWKTIYRGSDNAVPNADHQPDIFTHLAAPTNAALWMATYDNVNGVAHPHAYVASLSAQDSDAPPDVTVVDNALPPVGKPVGFTAAAALDATAYMLVETPPDPTTGSLDNQRRLFTTYTPSDPPEASLVGVIWKEIAAPEGFGPITSMVSPYNRTLWVWSGNKFAVTTNTLAEEVDWKVGTAAGEITTLAVDRSGVATIVTKKGQSAIGQLANVNGTITGSITFPIVPTTLTFGRRKGVMAVSGPAGTWGFDVNANRWVNITPAAVPFKTLTMANGLTTRYLVAETPDALWRFDTYHNETFLKPPPPPKGTNFGNFGTFPRSNLKDVELTPTETTVTIEPGKLHEEPVELKVPPDATMLDVFFIMDTTGSMSKSIVALRDGVMQIATGLRKILPREKEVCFGVGDVKDNQPAAGAEPDLGTVYRTHQKIVCEGPDLPKLKQGLAQLDEKGGGDEPEAQTIALSEAIKGTGQLTPFVVSSDQDAEFRPKAFKVIVLISDAQFHERTDKAGYPTIDEAVETLNSEDVKVVSVVVSGNNDFDAAKDDMVAVAKGTNTLAPEGGVDCDGDGKFTMVDLQEGDPLVCETSGSEPNIGPAVLSLLLAVQDFGTIGVAMDDPDSVVHDPIKGLTFDIRNLKRESHLEFTLPLMCAKAQDGLDLVVSLQSVVRGAAPDAPKARGKIVVQCRAPVIAGPLPPVVEEPVIEPPPKPRPPQAIAVQPPPQPPAQPVSNINLNAGFSQQEEQQFQLAAVTQGAQEGEQEAEEIELAMTGLDRPARDVASAAAMLAGAALLSTATGLAYRRRLQRSTRVRTVRTY